MTLPQAPPQPRTPPWRVITVIVMATVTMLVAWVGRPQQPITATMAPIDGASVSYQLGDQWWISEHAIMNATTLASSGPDLLAGVLSPEDLENNTTFWRQIDTVTSAGQVSQHHTVRQLTTDGDILRRGVLGSDGTAQAYTPGIPEFPAGTVAGSSWQASGQVTSTSGQQGNWSFQASATPADPALGAADCLEVSSHFTQDGHTTTETLTWCPDRGPLPPASGDLLTAPALNAHEEVSWDVNSWQPSSIPMSELTNMHWLTHLPPVGSHDGLLFAHQTANDLIDPEHNLARPHPGGNITTLTASGEVRLATTTQQEAVAYDQLGRLRWRVPLADSVPFAPAWRQGRVLITDVSAQATVVDGATGEPLWQSELTALPTGPGIWCEQLAVIPTTDGLVAFDAESGQQQWHTELNTEPTMAACLPGAIIVGDKNTLEVVDTQGDRLAAGSLPGGPATKLLSVGETVVVVSDNQLTALQVVDGRLGSVWNYHGTIIDAATDGHHVAVLGASELVLLDNTGGQRDSWPMPPLAKEMSTSLSTLSDGVASIGVDDVLRRSW